MKFLEEMNKFEIVFLQDNESGTVLPQEKS